MPHRAVTSFPDCRLGEFLVRRLQLLQADNVRLRFAEPAYQYRKAAINAVHIEGRDSHLSRRPFSGTTRLRDSEGRSRRLKRRPKARHATGQWIEFSVLLGSFRPPSQRRRFVALSPDDRPEHISHFTKLQLPGNHRQQYVRGVAAVVENGLRSRLPAAAGGLVLTGVQITIEPREVAGRNLQAYTMPR